jgi:plasmid stabilization system protein ParE
MGPAIRKSEFFLADFDKQFRWYEKQAGRDVAWNYLLAVDETLEQLAVHPDLGLLRRFAHPELGDIRMFLLAKPFQRHLVFLPA